jgi:hypothetical protein
MLEINLANRWPISRWVNFPSLKSQARQQVPIGNRSVWSPLDDLRTSGKPASPCALSTGSAVEGFS